MTVQTKINSDGDLELETTAIGLENKPLFGLSAKISKSSTKPGSFYRILNKDENQNGSTHATPTACIRALAI